MLAVVLCLLVGGAAWANLGKTPLWSREPAVKQIPLIVTSTPIVAEPMAVRAGQEAGKEGSRSTDGRVRALGNAVPR